MPDARPGPVPRGTIEHPRQLLGAAVGEPSAVDSAVDTVVIGVAEPDGIVLTFDPHDLAALAEMATGVTIRAL